MYVFQDFHFVRDEQKRCLQKDEKLFPKNHDYLSKMIYIPRLKRTSSKKVILNDISLHPAIEHSACLNTILQVFEAKRLNRIPNSDILIVQQ